MTLYDLTKQAMEKAKKLGGKEGLNCIAELDDTALDRAKALDEGNRDATQFFLGMPVLVKDNIDVKGLHTTAGSLALEDNVAEEDAPVIRNLRKHGAVILGKTNMTEFANFTTAGMPGGYSSHGGQVVNATDPALSPSGSSSGSAVAVAAGIVPAAVGTDTSFSVVACAMHNGICGLKPPVGTLSPKGIIPIAKTLDSAGAMAANFSDVLRLYSAMREEPLPVIEAADVSALRIAVNKANKKLVSAGQMKFLKATLKKLKKQGAHISKVDQGPTPMLSVIMQCEFKPHLEEYLQTSSASRKTLQEIVEYYEESPETMMKYGISLLKASLEEELGGIHGTEYKNAMEARSKMMEAVQEAIGDCDAVIMTGPTSIMHFCGVPSVSIAGNTTNEHGVRRGLILYGTDEYRLYRAALAIESLIMNMD